MKEKKRILFMDDDKIFSLVMSRMLSDLGYSVDVAGDGRQAVDLYIKEMNSNLPYSAVILDLYVPYGMDGVETMRKLLAIDPNVRAILSTGLVNDSAMKDFTQYGFQGVLPKPYGANELTEKLRRVINTA